MNAGVRAVPYTSYYTFFLSRLCVCVTSVGRHACLRYGVTSRLLACQGRPSRFSGCRVLSSRTTYGVLMKMHCVSTPGSWRAIDGAALQPVRTCVATTSRRRRIGWSVRYVVVPHASIAHWPCAPLHDRHSYAVVASAGCRPRACRIGRRWAP